MSKTSRNEHRPPVRCWYAVTSDIRLSTEQQSYTQKVADCLSHSTV